MRMNRKRVPTGWELNGSRAPVGRVASAEPQFAAQTPGRDLLSWPAGEKALASSARAPVTSQHTQIAPAARLCGDLAMASGRPMAFSPESWHSHSQEFATGR